VNDYSTITIKGFFQAILKHLKLFIIVVVSFLLLGTGGSVYFMLQPRYQTQKYVIVNTETALWKGDALVDIASSEVAYEYTFNACSSAPSTASLSLADIKSAVKASSTSYSVRVLITGTSKTASVATFLVDTHISSIKQRAIELYAGDVSFTHLTVESTSVKEKRINFYEPYIIVGSFFVGLIAGAGFCAFAETKRLKKENVKIEAKPEGTKSL
jgi:capsular polysaccharide biosynthesis protein